MKTNPPATGSRKTSSRPSSARSNASEGSRPPSGRKASLPHGDVSSRGQGERRSRKHPGDHRDFQETPSTALQRTRDRIGDVPHRFSSEPNLNTVDKCNDDFALQYRDQNGGMGSGDEEEFTSSRGHHDLNRIQNDHRNAGQKPRVPLEPDAFDRLADKISNRVKGDCDSDENNGQIKGHHCSKCGQLMVNKIKKHPNDILIRQKLFSVAFNSCMCSQPCIISLILLD